MGDISNKTLVSLLIVAIAISLIGTWVSVSKLGNLRITGLQTNVTEETGTAFVQIYSEMAIDLKVTSVNFGKGRINDTGSGIQRCELISKATGTIGGNSFTGTDYSKGAYCIGFDPSDTGVNYDEGSFVIENIGTVNVNVSMNSSYGASGFSNFFGGTTPTYKFKIEDEDDACSGEQTTWTDFSTDDPQVCGNLGYVNDSKDAFLVQINITLPEDAEAKAFNDTVTFTAYSP